MELKNLAILSTAHLHPLEAKHMNTFAYVANDEFALFNTEHDWYVQVLNDGHLICLAALLEQVREKYGSHYVLFDSDANVSEDFPSYDW